MEQVYFYRTPSAGEKIDKKLLIYSKQIFSVYDKFLAEFFSMLRYTKHPTNKSNYEAFEHSISWNFTQYWRSMQYSIELVATGT